MSTDNPARDKANKELVEGFLSSVFKKIEEKKAPARAVGGDFTIEHKTLEMGDGTVTEILIKEFTKEQLVGELATLLAATGALVGAFETIYQIQLRDREAFRKVFGEADTAFIKALIDSAYSGVRSMKHIVIEVSTPSKEPGHVIVSIGRKEEGNG